jgi:hypothetical protein
MGVAGRTAADQYDSVRLRSESPLAAGGGKIFVNADPDGLDDAQFWGVQHQRRHELHAQHPDQAGTCNSHASKNGIDYGDYTELSFYGGTAHPAWADNSNSTGNNPDGGLHQLEIHTAAGARL